MPRPKTYDEKEALTRACQAFWEHGYGALGVRALEALTGLNKFAIRTEFGGKEGLYLAALRLYADTARDTALAPLRTGGLEAIEAFLRGLVTEGSPTSSPFGCLIVNTGIENAELKSAALEEASQLYWSMLAEHFGAALRNARKRKGLRASVDPEAAAQALVTAVMGVHTANRVGQSHDAGAPLVGMLLDLLHSWRAAGPTEGAAG